MKIQNDAHGLHEVEAAIRSAQRELSPGIVLVAQPKWRATFRCRRCQCEVASFIRVVSTRPLIREARCGMCAAYRRIFD